MQKVKLGVSTSIEYTVYNADGSVAEKGVAENLITQHGRNKLASVTTGNWLSRLAVGTGTSVLEVPAGTASQTGTIVTADQDLPADVATRRACLFFEDGTPARVVTRVDSRHMTVDRSASVTSQPLTIVYDDVIKLNTYLGQTAVIPGGSTSFTDSLDKNSCTHSRWRTFTYTPATGVTLTEIGITDSSDANPDMHTVANLDNPIVVPTGGSVAIKYMLIMGIDTSVSNAGEVIDGIEEDVYCRVNGLYSQVGLWQFDGAKVAVTGIDSVGGKSDPNLDYHGWILEPYTGPSAFIAYRVFFSEEDYDIQQVPANAYEANALTGSPAPATLVVSSTSEPYSAGSFKSRISATTYGIGSANWRVFGLCNVGVTTGGAVHARCKFATPQEFGPQDFLTVVFEKSWEV